MKTDWDLYRSMVTSEMIEADTPLYNQDAKADYGKEPLSLVPSQIIRDIAWVRKYGNAKYGDPENWRDVEAIRYRDALYRHVLLYIDEPYGRDDESGLPHLWHIACNVAFLCEMDDKNMPIDDILQYLEKKCQEYERNRKEKQL